MAIDIKIKNLNNFKRAFTIAPRLTKKEINKAVRASLAEIMKRETDTYFNFKTERSKRTGMLQRTFHLDTAKEIQYLKSMRTFYHAETKSTVKYAGKVVRGGNPFYNRILNASKKDILKHNKKAIENVMKIIKKKVK